MSAASEVVGKALAEVAKEIRPGIDTAVLDQIAEEYLRDHGGVPAFKGYTVAGLDPFPGTLCISVDDVVVHGIPGGHILQEGELISVDCGVQLRSEEHTSELQSRGHLVCRLLLEKTIKMMLA